MNEFAHRWMTMRLAPRSHPCIGLLSLILLIGALAPAAAQVRMPAEPGYDTIKSGKCEVALCTDFDFGDHIFRMYSPGWAWELKVIPPGACRCKRVRKAGRDFDGDLLFGIQTADGRSIPGVSLSRVWPPGHPRHSTGAGPSITSFDPPQATPASVPNETTFEGFERVRGSLERVEDFSWRDDRFEQFHVFRSDRYGNGARPYYFVPKVPAALTFASGPQNIAFNAVLGLRANDDNVTKNGPTVSASFRFSKSVHFFQLFTARLTPSDRWVAELEETSRFLATRLRPASSAPK